MLAMPVPGVVDSSDVFGEPDEYKPNIRSLVLSSSLSMRMGAPDELDEQKSNPDVRSESRSPSAERRKKSKMSVFTAMTVRKSLSRMSPKQKSLVEEDKKQMRANLSASLHKEVYDVSRYYWSVTDPGYRGFASSFAQNHIFEKITLAVISVNALWISYDTDANPAETLSDADIQFQIAEHVFCLFFSFEWLVRFTAFRQKSNCLRDGWFVFDSFLVSTMVAETWVLVLILELMGQDRSGGNPLGNSALLRMARLLRLSRIFRMGRLLRAIPELLIQLKGLFAAMRSVLVTLSLLVIVIYIFAILIKQTMEESAVQQKHFDSVPKCMYSLLLYATFMDNLKYITWELLQNNKIVLIVLLMCWMLTGMAVQNMLIGVLCEVVSQTGTDERQYLKRSEVAEKVSALMVNVGCEGGLLTRDNFMMIFAEADKGGGSIPQTFNDIGVDLFGLLDLTDFIFNDEFNDDEDKTLTAEEFVDLLMQLRGERQLTVKSMVDMRKLFRLEAREVETKRKQRNMLIRDGISTACSRLERKLDLLGSCLKGATPNAESSLGASIADTAQVAALDIYTERLAKVESALAYSRRELLALKADIVEAPLKDPGIPATST